MPSMSTPGAVEEYNVRNPPLNDSDGWIAPYNARKQRLTGWQSIKQSMAAGLPRVVALTRANSGVWPIVFISVGVVPVGLTGFVWYRLTHNPESSYSKPRDPEPWQHWEHRHAKLNRPSDDLAAQVMAPHSRPKFDWNPKPETRSPNRLFFSLWEK